MSVLDPEKQAKMDQAAKELGETVPALLWQMYVGYKREGFDPSQALHLCGVYLTAMVQKSTEKEE